MARFHVVRRQRRGAVGWRSRGVLIVSRRGSLVAPVLLVLALLAMACDVGGDGEGPAGASPTEVGPTEMESAFVTDADCFGLGPAGGGQVECGMVEVPLDHDAPGEGSIEVAVVVDESTETEGAEAPVLLLGGGPGQAMVETYLSSRDLRQQADVGRTIIVIDQRGVGSSDPVLECPELPALTFQVFTDGELDAALDATGACRDRLAGQGVDLPAYNHLANARDVEMVRRALDYDQLNVRGASYGTQVALLAAEMFPDTVRSVVLSSPVDPQVNWMEDVGAGFDEALEALAASCAADDACTDQVGDLRGAIEETVERLDGQPEQVTVSLPDGATSTRTYTPAQFLAELFNFFYLTEYIQLLPAMVARARDGDLTPLANAVASVEHERAGRESRGMYNSMMCTGESGLVDPDRALANVNDELIAEHWFPHVRLGAPVAGFCERWDVEQIYDPAEISLATEVPTLVVTGGLDHVTLPRYGQQVHDALPVSHLVEVPQAVHSPLEILFQHGPCGRNIVTDFLDDPEAAPDADCAADVALRLGNPLPAGFG